MLWLLLLQVLVSCLWLGHSEVVTSFQSCAEFFFRETPPNEALHPKNPAQICQHYKDKYRFATLYNRDLRIPIYSAYIYQPGPGKTPGKKPGKKSGKKPGKTWMVEPQLISSNYSKTMQTEFALIRKKHVKARKIRSSQAISRDYKKLKGLDHGHLNPRCHQQDDESRNATFTLTNIVPQNRKLNSHAWNQYEVETMANKSQGCTTTYVVVGAVPGKKYIAKGRVNIPSHIWSGACCDLGNNQGKTWAVIAENDKNEVEDITLGELEKRLTDLYGKGEVSLFHPDCPRQ